MEICRVSSLTGIKHVRDLDVTADQLVKYIHGALVQEAFPHLSAADREFIKTGITPEEWESVFGKEDDDD